jgi:subtilisin family serine protease
VGSLLGSPGAPRAARSDDPPGRLPEFGEQFRCPSATRNKHVGVELHERLERERALVESRVREVEFGERKDDVVVEQQVEIDRPRAVPPPLPHTAQRLLDLQKHVEQRDGRKRRLDPHRRIEERRLLEEADGIGLAKRRDTVQRHSRQRREGSECGVDRPLPCTEVRTDPDEGDRHWRDGTARPLEAVTRPLPMGAPRTTFDPHTAAMRRAIASASAAVLLLAAATTAGSTGPPLLVSLTPAALCTHATLVARSGGTLVQPGLRLWLVPDGRADSVEAALRRAGALAYAEPNRRVANTSVRVVRARADFADPLVPSEWWRSVIRVPDLTPPGPGVPVTIVDSGVDFSHEEFVARPDLSALNPQEPAGLGGLHGTMVASVIGAPVNTLGLVGIYPQAVVRSYDAAIGDGTHLEVLEIVNGIRAATEVGKGVVNLSLGGTSRSPSIEEAVYEAIRRGSLVVAAAGNEGDQGNPLGYPAAVPHVLTVAATGPDGTIAAFSSRSGFTDLSAPGVDIPVALPSSYGGPYSVGSGTSFSAPLVSGTAAWLWTLRPELDASQIAEILRRSAADIGDPGWDQSSGYGLLDVTAALAYPTPAPDTPEPNDDIGAVDPSSAEFSGFPPLTTATRTTATVGGRLTRLDDPRDVFRLWLPRNRTLTVTATADRPITLQLFRQGLAQTVLGPGGLSDRLATLQRPAATATLTFRNQVAGRMAFLSVGLPRGGGRDAAYTVTVRAR